MSPYQATSTTRPSSPWEGQTIYETDTDKMLVYGGSAWLYTSTPQSTEIGAWQTWTPTVTPGSGTGFTFTTNSARYSQVNKIVTCNFDITCTTVGSASGVLNITVPVTATSSWATGGSVGTWREKAVTGDMGFVIRNTTTSFFLTRYDQGAILNTGRIFSGSFTYEAA